MYARCCVVCARKYLPIRFLRRVAAQKRTKTRTQAAIWAARAPCQISIPPFPNPSTSAALCLTFPTCLRMCVCVCACVYVSMLQPPHSTCSTLANVPSAFTTDKICTGLRVYIRISNWKFLSRPRCCCCKQSRQRRRRIIVALGRRGPHHHRHQHRFQVHCMAKCRDCVVICHRLSVERSRSSSCT